MFFLLRAKNQWFSNIFFKTHIKKVQTILYFSGVLCKCKVNIIQLAKENWGIIVLNLLKKALIFKTRLYVINMTQFRLHTCNFTGHGWNEQRNLCVCVLLIIILVYIQL